MARLTADQWKDARQRWEADPTATHESISEQFGVSRQAVSKKANAEGWAKVGALRQVAEKAQLKADAKVAAQVAQVAGATGKNAQQATLEASVEIRADVIDRHRSDWAEHRKLFSLADVKKDFESGKKAKISAEMLLIRQKGERAAYGLDDAGGQGDPAADVAKALGSLIERLPA
jgi:hypothetical protein